MREFLLLMHLTNFGKNHQQQYQMFRLLYLCALDCVYIFYIKLYSFCWWGRKVIFLPVTQVTLATPLIMLQIKLHSLYAHWHKTVSN